MFCRQNTANVILEDVFKARAGFDLGIPKFDIAVQVPGNVAEIIDDRQMRCGGNVGQRKFVRCQISAAFQQPVKIFKMKVEVV